MSVCGAYQRAKAHNGLRCKYLLEFMLASWLLSALLSRTPALKTPPAHRLPFLQLLSPTEPCHLGHAGSWFCCVFLCLAPLMSSPPLPPPATSSPLATLSPLLSLPVLDSSTRCLWLYSPPIYDKNLPFHTLEGSCPHFIH